MTANEKLHGGGVPDERGTTAEIFAQFRRLNLDLDESPYQFMSAAPGGAEEFLSQLRGMKPGVTWWDVFPDMPVLDFWK